MKDETEKIPPFVQDYLDQIDYEGYADFVKLSREYYQEQEDYPGKYATQSAHLHDFNRTTGQNRRLNYEAGLKAIDARYQQRTYQLAKQHGFKGPDPNQPAEKEFTRQGEKFQAMIDQARLREQRTQQPEHGQEAEDICTLKEQAPYQHNPARVTFENTKHEDSSLTGQQNLDQQRAAFLEKIKQTGAQPEQDKQPEI